MDKIVILTGPTATGKSSLSIELLERFPFEIINCDSMQVYKYFDIGTDKPDQEVLKKYPHHLLGYVEPDDEYDVKRYITDAYAKVDEIVKKGKIPLLVGGSGLYIKCFLYGLIDENGKEKEIRKKFKEFDADYLYSKLKIIDYRAYQKINKNDKYRIIRALSFYYANGKTISETRALHGFKTPKFNYFKLAIKFDRDLLYDKINRRVDSMIERGLIEETKALMERGFENSPPMKGIGYREMKLYLKGDLTKERAVELAKQNSRKYAKRQITWFKRENDIFWSDFTLKSSLFERLEKFAEE
jgi:tRNA dimethylallyltransferase